MPSTGTLLGKTVSDLQTDVAISDGVDTDYVLSGTLHYVTGYTEMEATSDTIEEGNFLALRVTLPSSDYDVSVGIPIAPGFTTRTVENGNVVDILVRVLEASGNLTFTVTHDPTQEQRITTYSLSGLTLEAQAAG